MTRLFAYLALALFLAMPLRAEPVTGDVIVAREGRSVSVFLRLPFDQVAPLFGRAVPGILAADGTLGPLEQGTYQQADALAQDVGFRLGGQDTAFEALSMMVHLASAPQPFDSPFDALAATSVCGVPLPETPPAPEDLTWMGGWYAYPVTADQPLQLAFPATGRAPLTLRLQIYDEGVLHRSTEITLQDGAPLEVPRSRGFWSWLGLEG